MAIDKILRVAGGSRLDLGLYAAYVRSTGGYVFSIRHKQPLRPVGDPAAGEPVKTESSNPLCTGRLAAAPCSSCTAAASRNTSNVNPEMTSSGGASNSTQDGAKDLDRSLAIRFDTLQSGDKVGHYRSH